MKERFFFKQFICLDHEMNLDQIEGFQCSEETLKKFDLQVKDKKEWVNLVNESIFRKCAKTNKEKYEFYK